MSRAINFDILTADDPNSFANRQAKELAQQQSRQQLESGQLELQQKRMQLEQATRERDALAQMQRKFVENGKSGDLNANFNEMVNSGVPHFVDIGMKGLQALQNQKNFERLFNPPPQSAGAAMPSDTGMPAATPLEATQKNVLQTVAPVNALAPAPANAMAEPSEVNTLRAQIQAAYALGTPQALAFANAREAELRDLNKPQTVSPGATVLIGGKPVYTAPDKTQADTQLIKNYNFAKAQGFKGSLFDYERSIASAGKPPAPAPAVTPVTILDPKDPNKTIVVDGRTGRQIGEGVKEGFGVQLPAKEKQKREAAYPQATSSIKSLEVKSDSFVKDLKDLRDDKGLDEITGLIAGRIPALSAAGRRAQAKYDKIIAKGGFQVLQDLRNASKTGGALGNVSNQEGKQLAASFAAIDRKQDAKDVRAAIDQAIADVEGSKVRMREAYDSTYEYRAPAKASGSVLDQADAILRGSK